MRRPDATLDQELLRGIADVSGWADPERVGRIASEISEGFRVLAGVGKAVSFFGSTRAIPGDRYYRLARAIAAELGAAGFTIITGGGPGIMAAANEGAQDAGALSVGLNIELPKPQPVNAHVDLVLNLRHFFVRKLMFVRYASAFVFLPGGYGTLDELFEALTLTQTGKIKHFPIVLAGDGHWDRLVEWLRQDVLEQGRMSPADFDLIVRSDDPTQICEFISDAHRRQVEASSGVPARAR